VASTISTPIRLGNGCPGTPLSFDISALFPPLHAPI
jgi:hypothetical protein